MCEHESVRGAFEECVLQNSVDQYCPCMRYVFEPCKLVGNRWENLVKSFQRLLIEENCCATLTVTARLMARFTAEARDYLEGRAEPFTFINGARLVTPSGNKRRLDEDVRDGTSYALTSRGTKSSRVLEFLGSSASTGASWDVKAVKDSWCAATRQITCSGVTVLCADPSSHGKPAQKINLSIVWDGNKNLGTCPPPLVPSLTRLF